METKEVQLGGKFVAGKLVSFDDDDFEKLEKVSQSLKQVERNVKESLVSKMK